MHILRLLKHLKDNKDLGKIDTELYFVDFSKAFDSVDHEKLFEKLKKIGTS